MNLKTLYQENENVVYYTILNGKTYFFFKGFSTAEEAKQKTFNVYLNIKRNQRPKAPIGLLKEEIDYLLLGEWSEIE